MIRSAYFAKGEGERKGSLTASDDERLALGQSLRSISAISRRHIAIDAAVAIGVRGALQPWRPSRASPYEILGGPQLTCRPACCGGLTGKHIGAKAVHSEGISIQEVGEGVSGARPPSC